MELLQKAFLELQVDRGTLAGNPAAVFSVGLPGFLEACPVATFLHVAASQVETRAVREAASQVEPLEFLVVASLVAFLEVGPFQRVPFQVD